MPITNYTSGPLDLHVLTKCGDDSRLLPLLTKKPKVFCESLGGNLFANRIAHHQRRSTDPPIPAQSAKLFTAVHGRVTTSVAVREIAVPGGSNSLIFQQITARLQVLSHMSRDVEALSG